jgi:hypothetical protein
MKGIHCKFKLDVNKTYHTLKNNNLRFVLWHTFLFESFESWGQNFSKTLEMLFHRQLFSSNSHWSAFFISCNQSIIRLISFPKHCEKTTVFRDQCFQEFWPWGDSLESEWSLRKRKNLFFTKKIWPCNWLVSRDKTCAPMRIRGAQLTME